MTESAPIVLFDGTCNFCDGAVRFILARERAPVLRFASIQSDAAAELLTRALGAEGARALRDGADGSGDPDSMILLDGEAIHLRSAAALRIGRTLRAPWRWLAALGWLVPAPIRDAVYRWVAKNRYRWFGRRETCAVPTPELRARFLG